MKDYIEERAVEIAVYIIENNATVRQTAKQFRISKSGSRLAKAVTYAKNQKPYMENYLLDGRCSISNNIAENIARPYAVGRKNFLFHDTVKGARASSIIYSLVETAKLNNLNIYAYLETVLLYMPDYKNEPEGIEELMPWSDMIQQRCRIKSKS